MGERGRKKQVQREKETAIARNREKKTETKIRDQRLVKQTDRDG